MNQKFKLTPEQQIRAVNSIFRNPNKYAIATLIFKQNGANPADISERTGLSAVVVSQFLKEMVEAGVMKSVETGEKKYRVYYHLTDLGRYILGLFY